MLARISAGTLAILTEVLSWFSSIPTGRCHHDTSIRSHPLQIIIYLSSYLSTIYALATGNVVIYTPPPTKICTFMQT
jgi:hypothetical protein